MVNPFGGIFAEEIVKGHKRRSLIKDKGDKNLYPGRLLFLTIILVFGLGFLLAKLFSLTIIEGGKYRKLSVENRIKETKILAPRGIIYDRNGKALVRNIPAFKTSGGQIYYENLPEAAVGVVKETIARDYIYNKETAHVLGYVGEADEDEVKNLGLELGDIIGKMGIEKTYDGELRGSSGKELVEVDALGNEVRVLGSKQPIPGRSLSLSIDERLQKIAQEELGSRKGAIIAENPKTGEILALYSSPAFDPKRLIRSEEVEALLSEADQPFFNRAISGLYPPGSTFKIVTAIAALESGAIDKTTKFEDTGILQVGQFSYANWYFTQYGKKEGMLSLVSAIKRSNDIFFYKAGEVTGIGRLADWAKKIGLGATLRIDIPAEAAGVMPDPSWRKKVRGDDWFLGDTYHVAIGQGDLQVTPLQVNAWTNVIASGGLLCRPHLRKSDSGKNTSDGVRQLADTSEVDGLRKTCRDLGIKPETISLIKEGMREACSPGGTGWPLFKFKVTRSVIPSEGTSDVPKSRDPLTTGNISHGGGPSPTPSVGVQDDIPMDVACKTGTAEFGDPKNRTHAWFTVFAPIFNPQISVTVLVEGGGEGSSVAGPIAKKILEGWFSD